jgi:ribosomal protein L37AE/L43A
MSMSKDKIVCPKCGSGNVVGFAGEWECFDCGHKFKTTTVSIRAPAPPPAP